MRAAPTLHAPPLDTRRLTLRGHTLADVDECAAMWADPEVTRHIGGRPSTAEETWARVLRYAGLWALLGVGYWVVRERATGRFVGEVGLADFRRTLTPAPGEAAAGDAGPDGVRLDGAPEVGWALAPWAHGRGFATEAVGAALAWADAHLGPGRTVCLVAPANAASARVAAKCGFRAVARAGYRGAETLLFERWPS
jgi:RimJ/RimL family protein N-acetyltransferase